METEKDQYGHPRMPYRGYYDITRCNERRKWVEKFSKCTLERVGEWWKDEGKAELIIKIIMFYFLCNYINEFIEAHFV